MLDGNAILEITRRISTTQNYDPAQVRLMGVAVGCTMYLYRQRLLHKFSRRLAGREVDSDDPVLQFIFATEDRWLAEMVDYLRNTPGILAALDILLAPGEETQALYGLVHAPGIVLA